MATLQFEYQSFGPVVGSTREYDGDKQEAINELLVGNQRSVTPIVSVDGRNLTEAEVAIRYRSPSTG